MRAISSERARRELAGLDHHAIAGGEDAGQRREGQIERENSTG